MPLDQQGFQIEPITRTDEVLNVLVKARALISNERNWCGFGPGDGRVTLCAARAIQVSAGFNWMQKSDEQIDAFILWSGAQTAVEAEIDAVLAEFNDADSTTHADMLALFDLAIAKRVADAKATP